MFYHSTSSPFKQIWEPILEAKHYSSVIDGCNKPTTVMALNINRPIAAGEQLQT